QQRAGSSLFPEQDNLQAETSSATGIQARSASPSVAMLQLVAAPLSSGFPAGGTGTRLCQSVSCWNASATLRTLASANGRPWIWKPIGNPSLSNPQGMLTDGSPM